jgi:hypothetical protein
MANNQFGPSTRGTERSPAEVARGQAAARRADADRLRAALAAGPTSRGIGTTRTRAADDADEM